MMKILAKQADEDLSDASFRDVYRTDSERRMATLIFALRAYISMRIAGEEFGVVDTASDLLLTAMVIGDRRPDLVPYIELDNNFNTYKWEQPGASAARDDRDVFVNEFRNATSDMHQNIVFGKLFDYTLTRHQKDLNLPPAYAVIKNATFGSHKGAAVNGMLARTDVLISGGAIDTWDRNTTVIDSSVLGQDYDRMLLNPHLALLVGDRRHNNDLSSAPQNEEQILEEAFIQNILAVIDSRGTGWHNLTAMTFWESLMELGDSRTPRRPLTKSSARVLGKMGDTFAGVLAFCMNGWGVSEDWQAAMFAVYNRLTTFLGARRRAQGVMGRTLYDAATMREAHERIVTNVLGANPHTWVRSPVQREPGLPVYDLVGNAEFGFLFPMWQVYGMLQQWSQDHNPQALNMTLTAGAFRSETFCGGALPGYSEYSI